MSVTAAVDGRLTLARDRLLMDERHGNVWSALSPPSADAVTAARSADLERLYRPQVFLEGSGSLVPGTAGPLTGLTAVPPDEHDALHTDFVPEDVEHRREKWFAVVDSRGRVPWTIKSVGDADLSVLVARATPAEYLGFLRREGICYLVVGERRVDLAAALRRMRERLGATCVVSTAGGGLNGALLAAGLVDELDLIVLPAAVGASTPRACSTARPCRKAHPRRGFGCCRCTPRPTVCCGCVTPHVGDDQVTNHDVVARVCHLIVFRPLYETRSGVSSAACRRGYVT